MPDRKIYKNRLSFQNSSCCVELLCLENRNCFFQSILCGCKCKEAIYGVFYFRIKNCPSFCTFRVVEQIIFFSFYNNAWFSGIFRTLCYNIYIYIKNLPSELPALLARHQRCVWPGVVLMADSSASVDQRWPLPHECCIQAVQLLGVQIRIERLAIGEQLIVDDSLSIPPNTQKNLPGRQSRLGSLTAFRQRPFALHK